MKFLSSAGVHPATTRQTYSDGQMAGFVAPSTVEEGARDPPATRAEESMPGLSFLGGSPRVPPVVETFFTSLMWWEGRF